jgi:hypothetical protein
MPLLVRPLAAVLTLVSLKPFEEDLRLIEYCGEATTMRKVRDEIAGHVGDASSWGFWRRRLHFRLSTAKLKEIAREQLEVGWSATSGHASAQPPAQSTP